MVQLRNLNGIESLVRLRVLSVHTNRLTTVAGLARNHPFLEVLMLHRNRLRNLERVLGELAPLMFVRQISTAVVLVCVGLCWLCWFVMVVLLGALACARACGGCCGEGTQPLKERLNDTLHVSVI